MWGWIEKCWGGVCACACTAHLCSHHQGNVAFDFPGRLMWPQGNFSPSLPSLLQKLCQLWEPLFYESEPVWEAFLMGELDLEMWKTLPSTCPSVSYRVSLCSLLWLAPWPWAKSLNLCVLLFPHTGSNKTHLGKARHGLWMKSAQYYKNMLSWHMCIGRSKERLPWHLSF